MPNAQGLAETLLAGKKDTVKKMGVRKKLIEMGAPPELLQRIKPYWQGNENQVMATYHKLQGNNDQAKKFMAAQKAEMKKKKKK